MALTDHEKSRIRAHMGYPNVGTVATFALGVPMAIEPMFMLESAMNQILPMAEDTLRHKIGVLDQIEAQMVDDMELLAVERVEEITINTKEQELLVRRFLYWRNALANDLSVIPNPYDKRFAGSGGVNVSVLH